MSSFSLKLVNKYSRPVVRIDSMRGTQDIEALVDTGADVPVWTNSVDWLRYCYGDCKFIKSTDLKGFGGKTQVGIYKLDVFKFGILTFLDFILLVSCDIEIPFDFIACAPMFDGMKYTFDKVKRGLNDEDYEKMIIAYKANETVRHVEYKNNEIVVCYNKLLAEKYLHSLESETSANLSVAYRDYFDKRSNIDE